MAALQVAADKVDLEMKGEMTDKRSVCRKSNDGSTVT